MEINICIGSACHLKGSYDVIRGMEAIVSERGLENQLTIKAAFCLGNCTEPVSVKFNGKIYSVRKETVGDFFDERVMPVLTGKEAEK